MIVIPIHSIIDRITNSSTEIFTNYENSVKAGYDLVQEFLDKLAPGAKAEDVVSIKLYPDFGRVFELVDEEEERVPSGALSAYKEVAPADYDWKAQQAFYDKIKEEDPPWFQELTKWAKDILDGSDGYPFYETLEITAKSPEYEGIAKKLEAFLNSPSSESYYC